MNIFLLDNKSLLALAVCQSPLQNETLEMLINSVDHLKKKGVSGFIVDLTPTPFVGSSAITFLTIMGDEKMIGSENFRIICSNPKIIANMEFLGVPKTLEIRPTLNTAVIELQMLLNIGDNLLKPPKPFKLPTY